MTKSCFLNVIYPHLNLLSVILFSTASLYCTEDFMTHFTPLKLRIALMSSGRDNGSGQMKLSATGTMFFLLFKAVTISCKINVFSKKKLRIHKVLSRIMSLFPQVKSNYKCNINQANIQNIKLIERFKLSEESTRQCL